MPNFGSMKVVFHLYKLNIYNLSISDPIKIPKLSGFESYIFKRSSFDGLNQPSEIKPIHLKQNFQLF